jgi:hypothetical protein
LFLSLNQFKSVLEEKVTTTLQDKMLGTKSVNKVNNLDSLHNTARVAVQTIKVFTVLTQFPEAWHGCTN